MQGVCASTTIHSLRPFPRVVYIISIRNVCFSIDVVVFSIPLRQSCKMYTYLVGFLISHVTVLFFVIGFHHHFCFSRQN